MLGSRHAARLTAVVGLLVVFGAVPSSNAEDRFDWATVSGEADTGAARALAVGDFHATLAVSQLTRDHEGRATRAVRAYLEAGALAPDDPEPSYRLAQVIYTLFISRNDGRAPDIDRVNLALDHWERFMELAPLDPRVPDVLFERSLTYTKQATDGGFARAVADYERLLSLTGPGTTDPGELSVYYGNKAELHMMLGELSTAIDNYEKAMDLGSRAWLGYGLAVALDRDGQSTKAREVMERNLMGDPQMLHLSQDGTFFVPAAEKHYYLALGYEVQGKRELASTHYKKFIASGAHPRFHERAREHIRRLER